MWFRGKKKKKEDKPVKIHLRQWDTASIIHCAKRKGSKNKIKLYHIRSLQLKYAAASEFFVAYVVGNRKARFT